jgi:hypothetical protein
MTENIIFMGLYKNQFYKIYLQNVHERRKYCYKLLTAMCYFSKKKNVCHVTF